MTFPSTPRTLILAALTTLAILASACGDSANSSNTTTPTSSDPTTSTPQIPVEALPDPLPTPYLFRDEIAVEVEVLTEIVYIVEPGDSLAAIADAHCVTTAEVQRLNTIVDPNLISPGDELRIPIREGACGRAAPGGVVDTVAGNDAQPAQLPGEEYVVQAGDTLTGIGLLFGVDWTEIRDYNNLTEFDVANLQIGQTIIIPPPPPADTGPTTPSEPPG